MSLKMLRIYKMAILKNQIRNFTKNNSLKESTNGESQRMKIFHEQLKLEKMPKVSPRMRFVDLVLVNTDPENGEFIPNSEKNPTKWGDWQHHGRVTDF